MLMRVIVEVERSESKYSRTGKKKIHKFVRRELIKFGAVRNGKNVYLVTCCSVDVIAEVEVVVVVESSTKILSLIFKMRK